MSIETFHQSVWLYLKLNYIGPLGLHFEVSQKHSFPRLS